MKKIIFLLFILVSFSKLSISQAKPEDIVDKFFYLYQNIGTDSAINYVFSTNKWMEVNESLINDVKLNLKRATTVLGPYYGYDIINKKYAGKSFVVIDCMLRYDKLPIKFSFILYRPDKKWQIHNVNFTDKFEKDFEAAPNVKAIQTDVTN